MRTEKEIQTRMQETAEEGRFNPTNPVFKYTHGRASNRSTSGYRHGFYAGFYRALEWILGESQSSKTSARRE